jgi:hypothetical protein
MSKEKYDQYDSYQVSKVTNTINKVYKLPNQVQQPVDDSNFGRAIKHIAFLTSEFNRTIIRMVSVTDMVLKNQLRDEHNLIADQLDKETSECYNALFQDIVIDHKKQYIDQIKEVSFMNSLIHSDSKKKVFVDFNNMRIRIPTSIQDRRLILIICSVLNYTIHIHDLEGYVVDSIGNGSIDLSAYINMFSRFDSYDSRKYTSVVKKPLKN